MIVSRAVTDNLTKRRGSAACSRTARVDDDVAFVCLLADEAVLVVPGSRFGMPGHVPISLTVERDTVVRALPGFARAFRRARG